MDDKKIDITFLIIGLFLTIVIPITILIFYNLTISNIFLMIFCVIALDTLCFGAHNIINKKE